MNIVTGNINNFIHTSGYLVRAALHVLALMLIGMFILTMAAIAIELIKGFINGGKQDDKQVDDNHITEDSLNEAITDAKEKQWKYLEKARKAPTQEEKDNYLFIVDFYKTSEEFYKKIKEGGWEKYDHTRI